MGRALLEREIDSVTSPRKATHLKREALPP